MTTDNNSLHDHYQDRRQLAHEIAILKDKLRTDERHYYKVSAYTCKRCGA